MGVQGWVVEKVMELMECGCGVGRLCCQDVSLQTSWLRGEGPKGLFSWPRLPLREIWGRVFRIREVRCGGLDVCLGCAGCL